MAKPTLTLTIISQEKQLARVEAEQVSAPTTDGEITVLPGHIPLLTRLDTGELRYVLKGEESVFVVSKGFLDVGPNNDVTVMVDAAVEARQSSLEKAEAAMQAAQQTMTTSQDQRELIMAEASLRRAMLEIKVAQKTKHTRI